MGVCYYVICEDCKISRTLNKNIDLFLSVPQNREEALVYDKYISRFSFKAGLLLSFMLEHSGHKVRIINDTNFEYQKDMDKYIYDTTFKREDDIFWDDI